MAEKAKETKATSKPLELVVDLDQLLIGEVEAIENPKNATEMIDMLNRVVTNVDIRTLPVSMLGVIRRELAAAITQLSADPNSDGPS